MVSKYQGKTTAVESKAALFALVRGSFTQKSSIHAHENRCPAQVRTNVRLRNQRLLQSMHFVWAVYIINHAAKELAVSTSSVGALAKTSSEPIAEEKTQNAYFRSIGIPSPIYNTLRFLSGTKLLATPLQYVATLNHAGRCVFLMFVILQHTNIVFSPFSSV
jgi:hypothetical protein